MKSKKTNKCIDCGIKIWQQATRCVDCHLLHRSGKPRKDAYTGLRTFICRAKKRKKLGEITLSDVLKVWERQKGVCVYSGVKLSLPNYKQKTDPVYLASLDRIESDKPYSRDNIQFVSAAINYMKGSMTHEETVSLCKLIALKWK